MGSIAPGGGVVVTLRTTSPQAAMVVSSVALMAPAPLGLAVVGGRVWDEAMAGRLCTDKGILYVIELLFI
jgi:hypothetical protein